MKAEVPPLDGASSRRKVMGPLLTMELEDSVPWTRQNAY
jgi:hypothetical protein